MYSSDFREQAAEGAALPAVLSNAVPVTTTPSAASKQTNDNDKNMTDKTIADDRRLKRTLPPVVFALPRSAAGDAGRRVVDFYMTWRGKTVGVCMALLLYFIYIRRVAQKTTPLKGRSRRKGFLDAEFRRVRETLDGEWKRASRALKGAVCKDGDGYEEGEDVGPVKLGEFSFCVA